MVKFVQGVENLLARTRLNLHNVQIPVCRSVDKVFKNFRQKLSLSPYVLIEKTTS